MAPPGLPDSSAAFRRRILRVEVFSYLVQGEDKHQQINSKRYTLAVYLVNSDALNVSNFPTIAWQRIQTSNLNNTKIQHPENVSQFLLIIIPRQEFA